MGPCVPAEVLKLDASQWSRVRCTPTKVLSPPLIIPQPSAARLGAAATPEPGASYSTHTHGDDKERRRTELQAAEINARPAQAVTHVGRVCFDCFRPVVRITQSDSFVKYYTFHIQWEGDLLVGSGGGKRCRA